MSSRDSRFELLRVVAIFFVVVHHLLLFGADACGYLSDFSPSPKGIIGSLLNSVVVTGVSLFVMITGWFGAKRVWRPMLRLIVVCAVFGAVAYAIALALQELTGLHLARTRWSLTALLDSMKFTNWWFMAHYLMLLLWAPLLEVAFHHVDCRGMERIVICLLVFNIVFGFAWGYVNSSGYNVIHFILLYALARYMRLFPKSPFVCFLRSHAVIVIVACVLAMTALFLLNPSCWPKSHTPAVWNYNDPLVILEAMAIFSLFVRIKSNDQSTNFQHQPTASPHSQILPPHSSILPPHPQALSPDLREGACPVRVNFYHPCVNFVARYVLGIYLLQSAPAIVLFRNALGRQAFSFGKGLCPISESMPMMSDICSAVCGYISLFLLAVVLCVVCWLVSWGIMSAIDCVKGRLKMLCAHAMFLFNR